MSAEKAESEKKMKEDREELLRRLDFANDSRHTLTNMLCQSMERKTIREELRIMSQNLDAIDDPLAHEMYQNKIDKITRKRFQQQQQQQQQGTSSTTNNITVF